MSKKALVIYNPTAKSQDHDQSWISRLVGALSHQGKYVVTLYPTGPETTSDHLVPLLWPELDLVVAAGGDGTIRQVLAALAKSKLDIPAALMPLGTGNVLARNLGIVDERFFADSLARAFDPIENGVPVRMDMGLMNGHYFAGMAGVGPLSDAFMVPKRSAKTKFKNLAYAKAMLETMAMRPIIFRITVAGRTFTVQASGVFVGNVEDLGLGKPCNLSTLTDGYLDLHILEPKDFQEYMAVGFRFAAGHEDGKAPHYTLKVKDCLIEVLPRRGLRSHFQRFVTKIRLLLEGKVAPVPLSQFIPAMIDGELCGTTPMHVSVIPQAVTILVPPARVQEKDPADDRAQAPLSSGSSAAADPAGAAHYFPGEVTGFITAAQIEESKSRPTATKP